jgi:hypothetical protein
MKLTSSLQYIRALVHDIDAGLIDLQPDFQRGEVWSPIKKKRLIDTILRQWHVPPVHIVKLAGSQEVLDGQQRLRAIHDFIAGKFSVDGSLPPHDRDIEALDGCYYEHLPVRVQRAFDNFAIGVLHLSDYQPEEPGELFFRLNQITALNPAEQRNAFYGPARHSVKRLVGRLQRRDAEELIGFSNQRLAIDDVIARFLVSVEMRDLNKKLTASYLNERFREQEPFPPDVFRSASLTLEKLLTVRSGARAAGKFNKATLYSWLVFLHRTNDRSQNSVLSSFFADFESERLATSDGLALGKPFEHVRISSSTSRALFRIYNDRSSSRVADVTSVMLRDVIIWLLFVYGVNTKKRGGYPTRRRLLRPVMAAIRRAGVSTTEETILETLDHAAWGQFP